MGHGRTKSESQISRVWSKPSNVTVKRSGQKIQPPARFNQVASPRDQPKRRGEVVLSVFQNIRE